MGTLIISAVALAFYAVQLVLCVKVKNLLIRLIPVGVLAIALAVFMGLLLNATGWDSLAYIVFVYLSGLLLIACAAGWGTWAVYRFAAKKTAEKAGK